MHSLHPHMPALPQVATVSHYALHVNEIYRTPDFCELFVS